MYLVNKPTATPKLSSDIYANIKLSPDYCLNNYQRCRYCEIIWHDQAQVSPELAAVIDKWCVMTFGSATQHLKLCKLSKLTSPSLAQ